MSKEMQPKIRFSGFTDDWEQRKYSDIVQKFEYGLNAPATTYDGIHKYIRITDIDDEFRTFKMDNITSPDISFDEYPEYLLKTGDVLFARTGASTGKTYLYDVKDRCVYFAGFLIRGHVKSKFDTNFFFQSTLTQSFKNFVAVTSQRSGQPGINSQEYGKYEISLPTKLEQEKIGKLLKGIDNVIASNQRKLDQLKELKKLFMQKIFDQEWRFKGFTAPWEQRKFESLVNRVSEVSDDKTLPRVEFNDIVSGEGRLNNDVMKKDDTRKGIKFCVHDVLFGKLRPYLKNWLYADFDGVALGDFWVFRESKISNKFIYVLIQSKKYQSVANLSTGTKMPRSDWKTVAGASFFVPKLNEESELIGAFFQHIDKIIASNQQKVDQLKNLKRWFMQNLFI